jgi:hypothetical protein
MNERREDIREAPQPSRALKCSPGACVKREQYECGFDRKVQERKEIERGQDCLHAHD